MYNYGDLEYHILELTDDEILVIGYALEYLIMKKKSISYNDTDLERVLNLVNEAIQTTEDYRAEEYPEYKTLDARAQEDYKEMIETPSSNVVN